MNEIIIRFMIIFIIRSEIIKNYIFVYLYEENNFAVDEDNTFIHKNNKQTIIKNKKYEIILLPIDFSIFPVFCYFNKALFI